MADSRPLANVIATYVNQQLLDEIAAEYAKGRVLLVGTANLDSLEPVIWNMTAIAASKDPSAIPLFRSILLASASIPGAFPPVMIDVNRGWHSLSGNACRWRHDGAGLLLSAVDRPSSQASTDSASGRSTSFAMRGSMSDWASVERRTMSIAARAIAFADPDAGHRRSLSDLRDHPARRHRLQPHLHSADLQHAAPRGVRHQLHAAALCGRTTSGTERGARGRNIRRDSKRATTRSTK